MFPNKNPLTKTPSPLSFIRVPSNSLLLGLLKQRPRFRTCSPGLAEVGPSTPELFLSSPIKVPTNPRNFINDQDLGTLSGLWSLKKLNLTGEGETVARDGGTPEARSPNLPQSQSWSFTGQKSARQRSR